METWFSENIVTSPRLHVIPGARVSSLGSSHKTVKVCCVEKSDTIRNQSKRAMKIRSNQYSEIIDLEIGEIRQGKSRYLPINMIGY